jgi:putative membrane protein
LFWHKILIGERHKKPFMKKNYLNLAAWLLAAGLWSCTDNSSRRAETSEDTTTSSTTTTTDTSNKMSTANTPTTTPTNTTPLSKEDSMFVMEAAKGGMMEVEAGNLAQQNATNQRVKDFGAMMVRDHSQANNELKSLVSSRGIMIPDSLPSDQRKHLDQMKKMTGKAFDSHYVSMMLSDHKKDVNKFEKESKDAKDADIRNWASKTLPTLKTHLDSIQAISKSKM